MLNNYGQDWRGANALVCATAVAPLAAGGSAAAWSVAEGNAELARGALQQAEVAAVRLGRRVVAVQRRHRMISPRNSTASRIKKSGRVKVSATASASGRFRRSSRG